MYPKISDIIFILELFSDFTSLEKTILFLKLNHIYTTYFIDWNKTYNLAIKLQFFKEDNDQVRITSNGSVFFSMRKNTLNLTDDQKFFVFKNGIFCNTFFKSLNYFLELFSINKNDILELYKTEHSFQKFQLPLEDKMILTELDVLINANDKFMINEFYSEIILHGKLFDKKSLSQSELDRRLKEQKEIGDCGEKLTLKYEKNQFKKKKWEYQEEKVRIIGKKNVSAGYDVESFSTKNSYLDYFGIGDKHIEVKSRKYDEFSFMISANELKIGKMMSERRNHEYLIYFWNNLGRKPLPRSPTRIIPFQKLKIKSCEGCLNYLVNIK